MIEPMTRRYPVGAECHSDGVCFRVWAPKRAEVAVVVDGHVHPLRSQENGYWETFVRGLGAGALYRFRLDQNPDLYPDPASRFQPEGPLGPSMVVDASTFSWSDAGWKGLEIKGQVLYEFHVGTFTPEGTWAAAAAKLPFLKDVGITALEMMPVADFTGAFGWGYDGVDFFAPTRLYGQPDDLRSFIDRAHATGLGVILDVVYNHFGPAGNFLSAYSDDYFTDRYDNEWGSALNFDGPNAIGMRDFVIANAAYWIDEYHFDGLRLDATQSIHDASDDHVVAALTRAARAAANGRSIIVIAENEPQDTDLVRPIEAGGYGLDGVWNDDLHHSAIVALTGRSEAYYEDHEGKPQEFISAAKYGYLFQGQTYFHQSQPRGKPGLDLDPASFVTFIENHDQVANSGRGQRFHQMTSPGRARAMTAFLLLMPGTPLLFQGQEFWATTPFRFMADHDPELAAAVRKGRREFLSQFPSLATPEGQAQLPDPEAIATFEACKLDWSEAESRRGIVGMHRDLLRLRRTDPAFRDGARGTVDGAVIGPEAFLLRFFADGGGDRLLVVNFGRDLKPRSIAEPLFAPPHGQPWSLLWSSEHPDYGGTGIPPYETEAGLHICGQAAMVLG